MTWQEKIRLGMELIKEGCKENQFGALCRKKCPFYDICNTYYIEKDLAPTEWEID